MRITTWFYPNQNCTEPSMIKEIEPFVMKCGWMEEKRCIYKKISNTKLVRERKYFFNSKV